MSLPDRPKDGSFDVDEVVEYALNRSLSLSLIAEYQTRLPDKALLQAKLHEFYALDTS